MSVDVARSIRFKVASGALPLPAASPEKCFVGKGTKRPCDGCDEIITADQLEYELDIAENQTLVFHANCLAAWHTVRVEAIAARSVFPHAVEPRSGGTG